MRARLILVAAAVAALAIGGALALGANRPPAPSPAEDEVTLVSTARFTGAVEDRARIARLAGLVRSSSGAPIAGALACDHPALGAATVCSATGADGRFSLSVPAGYHKLEVQAPAGSRFVDAWYDDTDRSRDATLLDLRKADRTDLVSVLPDGHRVEGRVTAAADGRAVPDAQACAVPFDGPGEWRCVRTDANGAYALTLAPARYQLFFVPPDNSRLIPRWWFAANDVLGSQAIGVFDDLTDVNVALVEGHLILGTVRAAGSEKPVENAFVCVDTPFPTGRICRPTDKQGRYSVSVRTGTFIVQFVPRVSARLVGRWYGTGFDPLSATRIGAATDVVIDGELASGKMLWGTIRGHDGRPLEGATVNVYDAGRPWLVVAATSTGEDGSYATVVPPGSYLVQAFPAFGQPYLSAYYGASSQSPSKPVVVKPDDDEGFVDVTLDDASP